MFIRKSHAKEQHGMLRHYLSQDFTDNMGFRIHVSQPEVQALMLSGKVSEFYDGFMKYGGIDSLHSQIFVCDSEIHRIFLEKFLD